MADLSLAVEASAAPTTLALYGFEDLPERLESLFDVEGDELIAAISKKFVGVVGGRAVLYEPRRGDLCVLFSGKPKKIQRALDRTTSAIESHARRQFGLKAVVGVVELPGEADTADDALTLADERRGRGTAKLRAAARRPLSARVSKAIGRAEREDYLGRGEQGR